MRKVLVVLLSVVFVLSLFAGCTRAMTEEEILQRAEELQAKNASQGLSNEPVAPTKAPTVAPTKAPTEEPKPTVSDSIENIGEIDFSVPSIWRKEEAAGGFYYYPYADNATLLYVRYENTDNFPAYDITDKDMMTVLFDSFIDGIKSSTGSYNQQSKEVKSFIDGTYYLIVNYTGIMGEEEYEFLTCAFFTSTYNYSITFGQPSNISKSFRDTYGKILDSLQINQPTSISTPSLTPTSSETVSQRNALRTAKDYLDYKAFSRKGLIEQLEYEGYSNKDATYGVDNCGADWMEQAAKCAKDYLDYKAFSKKGLIEQLEYEGFTKEQAEYGVSTTGL